MRGTRKVGGNVRVLRVKDKLCTVIVPACVACVEVFFSQFGGGESFVAYDVVYAYNEWITVIIDTESVEEESQQGEML